jgi:hypothetical protein
VTEHVALDDPRLLPCLTQADIERIAAAAPPELIAAPIWVCGSRAPKAMANGTVKSAKTPISPATGRNARSNEATTWGAFKLAAKRALMPAGVSDGFGIGLLGVNLLGGQFVGLDFDHVIDSATGELAPAARALIDALPRTYTEVSPSGTGLRLFYRGSLPPGFSGSVVDDAFGPGTQLEAYDGWRGARYLSVTGKVYEDRGAMVAASHADLLPLVELQQRVRESKKPTKNAASRSRHPTDNHDRDVARARWGLLDARLLDPDLAYPDWIRVLAALRPLGDEGHELADQWSRGGAKYVEGDVAGRGSGLVGSSIATLFGMFDDAAPGWRDDYARNGSERPATFTEIHAAAQEPGGSTPDTSCRPSAVVNVDEYHALLKLARGLIATQPDIAAQDGRLVQVMRDEHGNVLRTTPMTHGMIRERLSRIAIWLAASGDKSKKVHPPETIVHALVEARDRWEGISDLRDEAPADAAAAIAAMRNRGAIVRSSTGLEALDRLTRGGFPFASRIVIQGAPDAGKTIMLMQIGDTMACAGVHVGILAIDEDREDIIGRLLQRRGCTRDEVDALSGSAVEAALRDVEQLPLRVYDSTWTIDRAADDLALHSGDAHRALLIDSIQVARCDADDDRDNETANVSARMAAVRAAATRHKMLVICTSEMSRGSYRSAVAAATTNDMAAAKHSGAIEYAARALFTLRSVPGSGGVVELRTTKNKLGPCTTANERGTFLRLHLATQHISSADDYQPAVAESGDEDVRVVAREDAAIVAVWLAQHPGKGRREMHRGLVPEGLGRSRADGGLGCLENAGAIVERHGPKNSKPTFLIGERVPGDVLAHVPASLRDLVLDAAPPAEPPDPTDVECAEECVNTLSTLDCAAGSSVCVAPPLGGRTHTHTAGAAHECAEASTMAEFGGQTNTLDDGQPEQPKGKRRKAKARVVVEPERVQPDDADFEHGRGEVQP